MLNRFLVAERPDGRVCDEEPDEEMSLGMMARPHLVNPSRGVQINRSNGVALRERARTQDSGKESLFSSVYDETLGPLQPANAHCAYAYPMPVLSPADSGIGVSRSSSMP